MSELDNTLAEYADKARKIVGQPITRENLPLVIEHLLAKERKSYGILKTGEVRHFLEDWFRE